MDVCGRGVKVPAGEFDARGADIPVRRRLLEFGQLDTPCLELFAWIARSLKQNLTTGCDGVA